MKKSHLDDAIMEAGRPRMLQPTQQESSTYPFSLIGFSYNILIFISNRQLGDLEATRNH